MLWTALEHKSSLIHTLEIANERPGIDIHLTNDDWSNAERMVQMLEPFFEAVESLEADSIGLPELPCIMTVLNSHIESETAAFNEGPFATAGDVMLVDHADRWDELPDVVKMAAALSPRTKDLGWLSPLERQSWRGILLVTLRSLFSDDIAAEADGKAADNAAGLGASASAPAEDPPPKRRKLSFRSKAIATARGLGPGDETGGAEGCAPQQMGRGSSSARSGTLLLSARMDAAKLELQRFQLEKGFEDDDIQEIDGDGNAVEKPPRTGKDDLEWWCRLQFSFPSLARLAVKFLAIPPSSAASERVFSMAGNIVTKKCNRLGDDSIDALVFLNGSHGLAWSSGISQEELGRKKNDFGLVF